MRYAHTLLFVCPDCNLPIAVSRISLKKSLETVASTKVQIKCEYCSKTSEVNGVAAKMHWVIEWDNPTGVPEV